MSRITDAAVQVFAMLVFCIVTLAYIGPAIDDHSGESAADDAIAQIRISERREAAARAVCGQNAGYQYTGATLQCFTHRGAKSITVSVAQ